ncbi:MAG: hypothetical protein IKI81_03220, partial [Selenomonadaceae bacterium]|nr:hypothetical protein [Selenomonadaceae bacterium]
KDECYRVDSTQGKYAPYKTRYGNQYDMDRILVIALRDGGLLFADQEGHVLDLRSIKTIKE